MNDPFLGVPETGQRRNSLGENLLEAMTSFLSMGNDDGSGGTSGIDGTSGDVSSSVRRRVVFSEEVPVCDIPIRAGRTIAHRGVYWRLKWRVQQDSDQEVGDPDQKERPKSSLDMRALYCLLFRGCLQKMSLAERLSWAGELLPASAEETISLAWPFCHGEDQQLARSLALFEAHSLTNFNSQVLDEAVKIITETAKDQLEQVAGMEEYLSSCAVTLAECNADKALDGILLNQIHYTVISLDRLRKALREDFFTRYLLRKYEMAARKRLSKRFGSPNLEEIRSQIQDFALPTLGIIDNNFAGFSVSSTMTWRACLAGLLLDQTVPIVRALVVTGNIDAILAFNVFRDMRKIQEMAPENVWGERFFTAFEPCLPLWAETMRLKAQVQVTKVLELERERHRQQDWENFYDERETWLDSALNLDAIFASCEVTWINLRWPNFKKNLEFGVNLLGQLEALFKFFVKSFHDIVMEDEDFDRVELVIILNSISHSSRYMKDMFANMNQFLLECHGEPDRKEPAVKEKIQEFTKICDECGSIANAYSEDFVKEFCKGEKRNVKKYVAENNIFDEENPDTCFLGYLNLLLAFFHEHLDMSSEEQTQRFNRMIQNGLFSLVADEIEEYYHSTTHKVLLKLDFKNRQMFEAIDEIVKFRNRLGLPQDVRLEEMRHKIFLQSSPSSVLIGMHQKDVLEAMEGCREEPEQIVATLVYQGGVAYAAKEIRVYVALLSLSRVRPRGDKKTSFPSVTVRVLPSGTPAKATTKVFDETDSVLFDLDDEGEKGEGGTDGGHGDDVNLGKHKFAFTVSKESLQDEFTCLSIELFDHSFMKTHKVFRGLILVPHEDLPRLQGLDRPQDVVSELLKQERREAVFVKVPKRCGQSPFFKELSERLDSEAAIYVDRVERQISGSRIVHSPSKLVEARGGGEKKKGRKLFGVL